MYDPPHLGINGKLLGVEKKVHGIIGESVGVSAWGDNHRFMGEWRKWRRGGLSSQEEEEEEF